MANHCMLCGMPAIGMLRGTTVCNNKQCQEAAGLNDLHLEHLSPSPPAPLEDKYHTGGGAAKRVPGPQEVAQLQGVLRKGATGAELWVPDMGQVVRICPSDEVPQILEFLRDNFPDQWPNIVNWFLATVPGARLDPPEEEADKDRTRCLSMSPLDDNDLSAVRCDLPAGDHDEHVSGDRVWRFRRDSA